ncbi:MAG TPA: sugar phosphate isomerase/epimerase family protein [Planctomycetota bacterium]|nr:sugar phosphate isomerase/epimerase family protein [Planctomycetota bacterium]
MKQEAKRSRQRVGACSWSLQARDPAELARLLGEIGVDCVQLHLDPLRTGAWSEAQTLRSLAESGIEVRSGMMSMEGEDYSTLESIRNTGGVRPRSTWDKNRVAAEGNAKLARRFGIDLVTFHAGFLPHDRRGAEREVLLSRLRELADIFSEQGVRVGFETGQESAATLLEVLADLGRDTAGINFDPANMILYAMGYPVSALRELASRVLQIHVKDARATKVAGTWGEEVRVGEGQVDWTAFFAVVREQDIRVDWMIEREAGSQRVADMRAARELLELHA